ncbi:MAG: fused response regulator/phosphatase [Gammaproteobacteria bacterium]|nr:fused response regulator/phosphatase [Gammaproteobacteria bacterium]
MAYFTPKQPEETGAPVDGARRAQKILVVDDDLPSRLTLVGLIESQGHQVLQADDGVQALAMFRQETPDLILMSGDMPHIDGYEATRQIKASDAEAFVPVIFLATTSNNQELEKCLDAGSDDVIEKPCNPVLLKARINALLHIRDLYHTVQEQKNELTAHQKRLQRERLLAGRLFTKIVNTGTLELPNIKSMLSPMSLFSGDILLSAPKPSSGLHVLLGDFTGHGLAAATGALPVASVFYGMTEKGYSVAEIVSEINTKLRNILPTDMFLAACMIDLNPGSHTLTIWNGGIPPVIIYSGKQKRIVNRIVPRHLPLGVAGDKEFNRRVDVVDMKQGDRIYIHSDGITETIAPSGEMFGRERLTKIFESALHPDDLYDEIRARLQAFRAGGAQRDDVTLIEIEYHQAALEATVNLEHGKNIPAVLPPSSWNFSLDLGAELLRHFDPLPMVIQAICDMQGFHGQRQQLYTVFSELFSNALDHGILNLDSQLKKTADGFAKYYLERESRLATQSKGKITIEISHKGTRQGGELTVRVEDTGKGFNHEDDMLALEKNQGNSGRGIPLLYSMCDEVKYHGSGNAVTVVFRWCECGASNS